MFGTLRAHVRVQLVAIELSFTHGLPRVLKSFISLSEFGTQLGQRFLQASALILELGVLFE